jgi:hypothetical protein
MEVNYIDESNDSHYEHGFDYKKWKTLGIVGIVSSVVLFVIVILVLIFVIAPLTAQPIVTKISLINSF